MPVGISGEEEAHIGEWVRTKFAYPFKVRFAYSSQLLLTAAGKFQDFVVELPAELHPAR